MFTNGLPNSKGYPQNLRKIAIVNGSLLGNKEFENPFKKLSTNFSGTTVTNHYATHSTKALKIEGDAHIIGHVTTLESYFLPSYKNHHKIAYFKKKNFSAGNIIIVI